MTGRQIWCLEMLMNGRIKKYWRPCVMCKLTKHDAVREASRWRAKNPHDQFRVVKYVAAT